MKILIWLLKLSLLMQTIFTFSMNKTMPDHTEDNPKLFNSKIFLPMMMIYPKTNAVEEFPQFKHHSPSNLQELKSSVSKLKELITNGLFVEKASKKWNHLEWNLC